MIDVVAAIIWRGDRFLLCQRGERKAQGLKWEFVGGKVEAGESERAALRRECMEELGISIEVGEKCTSVENVYPTVSIRLHVYHATIEEGEPTLTEHHALTWVTPAEAKAYDLCEADKKVLTALISVALNYG